MISISEALEIIHRETPVLDSEKISLTDVSGRVLAEDIVADSDLPPFDRSQMDGFAVKSADVKNAPLSLKLVGESAAGAGWHNELKSGEAVRIMTGAPVPVGADAVQQLENAVDKGNRVDILERVKTGKFIVAKGSEIEKGEVVFTTGQIVSNNMIASLAAFGYASVSVAKRPKVAIISTGSEIVPISELPKQDQIRDSNSAMLAALVDRLCESSKLFPLVADNIEALKIQISDAVKECDLLIISGGVSVGKYDFTKVAIEQLGGEVFFDKIALKPGKPTVFARVNNTMIFGLPGNPVSSAVTFYIFVRTALLLMQSALYFKLDTANAICGGKCKAVKERDTYLPARLSTDPKGHLVATPLKWLGSSDFIGFAQADALIFIPMGEFYDEGEVTKICLLT